SDLLDAESLTAVEDIDAVRFEPGEVIVRRENRAAPPAPPRGWTHAIKCGGNDRRLSGRIECMTVGVHAQIGRAAAIELREERTEPIGVFVENQKGSRHVASPFESARRGETG